MPIRHPALFWAQLISESHLSRVAQGQTAMRRWHNQMATEYVTKETFRKSAHWSGLNRMHAMLAAYDEHVWPRFEWFCHSRVCSDEWSLPLLILQARMWSMLDMPWLLRYIH